MNNYSKIAFIGWNPFQFRHIESIAKKLKNSFFILEKKKNNNISHFSQEFFENSNNEVIVWEQGKIHELDGKFELFICQVPFQGIEKINKTRIIFIQYGYAKDPHNYGIWRAFAHVNFVYGNYAKKNIESYTPIEVVGNPETDKIQLPSFKVAAQKKFSEELSSKKKIILYSPTWGDLSSIDVYLKKIIELSKDNILIIKLHHNTCLIESTRYNYVISNIYKNNNVTLLNENDDIFEAICVSDLVISDYSGSIFDAFYCKKPLILLNVPTALSSAKEDKNSLEQKRRNEIGYVIKSPDKINEINSIYKEASVIASKSEKLWNELYPNNIDNSSQLIVNKIEFYLNKKSKKTESQKNIRKYLRETYAFFKSKKNQ